MTAIYTGSFSALAVNMADDDVELVSDHPEQIANDDIDIDIDLSADQHDEDFILEDAQFERDLEDTMITNDDIMQDEEDASYHMDDVDLMREEHAENLQMEDAYESEIPRTDFISTASNHIQHEFPQDYASSLNIASRAAMDDLSDHRTLSRGTEEEPVIVAQEQHNRSVVGIKETENFESVPTTSSDHRNFLTAGRPEGQSPSLGPEMTTLKSAEHDTQKQNDYEDVLELDEQNAHDHNGADHITDLDKDTSRPKVIVAWRDVEYDLIAATDADDPDSFFLKDDKLTKEPLTSFLTGLREVILEELTAEDELCFSIEGLGLEVAETSSILDGLTFENILDLYGKLLRNDGVERPEPLCINLRTKPHFMKRMASLIAGAAGGKGLSEYISWEEGSQELGAEDQSTNPEDNEQQFISEPDHAAIPIEIAQHGNDEVGHATTAEQNEEEDLYQHTVRATDGAEIEEEYGHTENNEHTNSHVAAHSSDKPYEDKEAESPAQKPLVTAEEAKVADYPLEEVDEDGDLIDYSDDGLLEQEEPTVSTGILQHVNGVKTQDGKLLDLIESCLKPAVCFCSTCNEHLLIQYEAINEDLRRRSLSLAAEQEEAQVSDKQQHDNFGSDQNNAHLELGLGSHGSDGKPNDGIGHPDEGDSFYQAWNDEDEYENDFVDGKEHFMVGQNQVRSQNMNHEDEIEHGKETSNLASEIMLIHNEPTNPFKENKLDDESYEDLAVSRPIDDETSSTFDNSIVKGNMIEDAYLNPDEISYDEIEGLNSNESEHTLVADEPARDPEDRDHEVSQDEISYEDDDHPYLSIVVEHTTAVDTSPMSTEQSGKRSRTDTDEATEGDFKYSKRLRS